MAMHRFNRGQYDECVALCSELLSTNAFDQAVWCLKTRALTMQAYVDDLDFEEEGAADVLLDENATAALPRPGTSLNRPKTQSNTPGQPGMGMRPVSASGRPLSGYARPGTGSARPDTKAGLSGALAGAKPGASRPMTALGRLVRLGTASMVQEAGGPFINADRLDLRKYAQRPALSRALFDYILYVDHNPKKALELASQATAVAKYDDWWWKERLGKCYYMLGLYREAEKQFASSIKTQPMAATYLELANVSLRLDQPKNALLLYAQGADRFPADTTLQLGAARVHEALGDLPLAVAQYKRVLAMDPSNVEAIACIAAHHFYSDQPELALRFYRRLLQMGVHNTEIWTNLGLCCFYASQYDMTLSCLERALALASDDAMADVWYNIGQVAIGIGDLGLAYQAFKIAVSVSAHIVEAAGGWVGGGGFARPHGLLTGPHPLPAIAAISATYPPPHARVPTVPPPCLSRASRPPAPAGGRQPCRLIRQPRSAGAAQGPHRRGALQLPDCAAARAPNV